MININIYLIKLNLKMDSYENLTVDDNKENTCLNQDLKLQLEENYYEKLFIEEMNFRKNPTKVNMRKIIQKHCQAVEYFSSIGDNKKATKYKLLNNIFLNDPQVIQALDKNEIFDIKNNNIKGILISNQKENMILIWIILNQKNFFLILCQIMKKKKKNWMN